jgi:magnesium chelatase family protein
MNPCPCGYAGTPRCNCTPIACERYRQRLSGPVLDRFDLRVHVPAVRYADLSSTTPGMSTADMQALVARARDAQRARFGGDGDGSRRRAE